MPFPNPLYISSTPLQWYFIDRETAEAMQGGIVTFYEQDSQTTLKPIYQLDNSSPTGFSELNNPIQLTAVGTFADNNGNDIIPYFYPYNLITGEPELYYVTVYNSQGVLQFTREDWPPNMGESSNTTGNEIINYVANGQFLINNYPAVVKATQAVITTNEEDNVLYIAPGGWTFEFEYVNPPVSPPNDAVTFLRELTSSAPNETVDANPRYYCQIATSGNDANYLRKDLCLKFPDVNKFSGNTLTFSWQGFASSGGTPTVMIILRQYFGTGSATYSSNGNINEITIGSQVISESNSVYNIAIPFPPNTDDTVSPIVTPYPIDNDYVQICLRLPNSAQTVQFTDFVLTPSIALVTEFPLTPNADFIRDSTIGYLPTPNPAGYDLYLPLILTPQGTSVDYSQVGTIIAKTQTSLGANELRMDGATYVTSAYSTFGIPYQRLMNYLLLNSTNVSIAQGGITATLLQNTIPMYGTGPNFVTLFYESGAATSFLVQINTVSTLGAVADSSGGTATGWGFAATNNGSGYLIFETISSVTVPTAGQYWTFKDGSLGKVYNVWYSIAGVGTAPTAPTGANINVNLVGTQTPETVITATINTVNQYQFMVLDLRGYFLRGLDTAGTVDPGYSNRSVNGIVFNTTAYLGPFDGSYEAQAFLSHNHSGSTVGSTAPLGSVAGSTGGMLSNTAGSSATLTIVPNGGNETRPINVAVSYFIKI